MSLQASDFTTIASADGESFVIETKLLPSKISPKLPYSSKVVEKVMEYICYKHMYQFVGPKNLPKFEIEPELALEVLKASI